MAPSADDRKDPLKKDKKKIALIQERFKYADTQWSSIRNEAKEDMRHVIGDPWEPAEKLARQKAMRPTPANDEISQYLNQVINSVKEDKRAIGFNPVGFGADDKTAEFYDDKWREVWYRSHAQQHTAEAFQNMVERSYGFCKVRTEYVTDVPGNPKTAHSAFNKRIVIDGVPDPDVIYPDPDFLDRTGRDWKWLFEIETQGIDQFRKNFPNAAIQSFNPELVKGSKGWISGTGRTQTLRIASYWEVEQERETLNAWEGRNPETGATEVYELFDHDEEMSAKIRKFGFQIIDKREVETPKVTQYRTNGVEILKTIPWPGKWIPYVAFYGKMLWDPNSKELVIQSMVRQMRGPNMLLAYYLACEMELIGMTPKTLLRVFKGALDKPNAIKLQKSTRVPVAFVEFNSQLPDGTKNDSAAALGVREQFEPPIQAIELAKEACRRAMQSAAGITPLQTSMQRDQKLSGRALEKQAASTARGAYHFTAAYDGGLVRLGELGEDLIPKVYDTAGPTPVLDTQNRPKDVFINTGLLPEGAEAPEDALPSIEGLHAVTIEVEPDFASQRDKGADFVTTFIGSPVFQLLPPQMGVQVLALMVKLLNLGPIGKEIADILHPPDQEQGVVPVQKYQEAVQTGQQLIQALQAKIQEYEQEKQAKILETEGKRVIAAEGNRTKMQIAALQADAKLEDRDRQSETMIVLQKMKENLEMLITHAGTQQEKEKINADISKTSAQLAQSTAMEERGRESTEREGERNRQASAMEGDKARAATAREGAANRMLTMREGDKGRQSAEKTAAENRKAKADTAKKPPSRM